MDFRKLEKSLLLRVEDRLRELLPHVRVRSTKRTVTLEGEGFSGEVQLAALTTACLAEDRANWGAIAGGFCNLVAARVESWFAGPFAGEDVLSQVLPAVEAVDESEDALIREATPVPELTTVAVPWLHGLRLELDCRQPGRQGRMLQRDIDALGFDVERLASAAADNLREACRSLEIASVDTYGPASNVFCTESEGLAPGLLTGAAGHTRLFDTLAQLGVNARRILACAPRSDLLYFCDSANKGAASSMVSLAWRAYEADTSHSVPLSPRLFLISAVGDVGYLDVGLASDRVPDWNAHQVGDVLFQLPSNWRVDEQDGQHVVWTSADGPRVRIRFVASGGGSPVKAHELAERVRNRHGISAAIGHGFFNGLPWAWVDTGVHSDCATASMFVVLENGLAILQTEVPSASAVEDQTTLQRVIATVHTA